MPDDIQTQLMTIFDFTAADLEANRAGHFSAAQQAHLEANASGFWKKFGLIALVIWICALGFLAAEFIGLVGDAVISLNPLGRIAVIVVMLIVTGGAGIFLARHQRTLQADLNNGIVYVEGQAELIELPEAGIKTLKIGAHVFGINAQVYDAAQAVFEPPSEEIFIAYYLPYSDTLLAIEPANG